MPRPKGTIDRKKRKRKTILTGHEERKAAEDFVAGLTNATIMKKYGLSKSALCALKKRHNIKSGINHTDIAIWKNIANFDEAKEISGIYCIYFLWKYDNNDAEKHNKINDIKTYIGSSVDIGTRLAAHKNALQKNQHYNKELQAKYNDTEFCVKYAIIEECGTDSIMQRERYYLNKWDFNSLLNTWKALNEEDIRPWLEKAVSMDSYSTNFTWSKTSFYNGTPCKEANYSHKSGYSKMKVILDQGVKTLNKHRIAYWEKYAEYPELVRHLCDNRKCYNPEHLAAGNHRDNSLDKRGDFPQEFEKKWVEYEGDLIKLTEEFGWKTNTKLKEGLASSVVYEWEKKLGIRDKYPEIVQKRFSRQIYTAEMREFISELLDTHTNKQIKALFLEKFNMELGKEVIRKLGGGLPEGNKNDPIIQFIKDNLGLYYDVELCALVNLKFNMELSTERFTTFRFKNNIYRGGLKPEVQLKRKDSEYPYGIEFKEFLRTNYLQYTDEELAVMVIEAKIISGYDPMSAIRHNITSFVNLIKEARLVQYGFLRDNEEAVPSGYHWQTGEPIYAFLLNEN